MQWGATTMIAETEKGPALAENVSTGAELAALRGLAFRRSSFVAAAVFAFAATVGTIAAHAAEPAGGLATIDSIRIGFAAHYKVGFWTPINVALTGNSKSSGASAGRVDLQVIVPDGDGVPTATVERGIILTRGKSTHVRTCVKFGRPTAAITVIVTSEDNPKNRIERTFSGDAVPARAPRHATPDSSSLVAR